jgi:uncharacterized protein YndB with AHSA1/START domain
MSDAAAQIAAVERTLATRELPGGEAKVATLSRTYDAHAIEVWDALTHARRISRWFLPVSGELVLDGHYQLEGNAGGVVEECEPPLRFAVTWEMGDQVSWVMIRLDDTDDGTRLTLEHTEHTDPGHWAQYGPGATGIGWDQALLSLAHHLGEGRPIVASAWPQSPEGLDFTRRSGEAWYAAAVGAGEDESAARAAADRTIAAYTAAPE